VCFILNPKFTKKNLFRVRFLLDCIDDLGSEFSKRNAVLQILYGDYAESLKHIISLQEIDAIFINQDFTPFAKKRQDVISGFARTNKIQFHQYIDHLLYDPDLIRTKDGKPYTIFSQFFRTATQMQVARTQETILGIFMQKDWMKSQASVNPTLQLMEEEKMH
jgi:deoxyribodipyrimidine photo-lyase